MAISPLLTGAIAAASAGVKLVSLVVEETAAAEPTLEVARETSNYLNCILMLSWDHFLG